jgi:deoxyribodipyrimidine photo-lyase
MSKKQINVVWLQTNLRLTDNKPLKEALKENHSVVLFFCWADMLFKDTPYSFPRIGTKRETFLKGVLDNLERQCIESSYILHVSYAPHPLEGLRELAKTFDVQSVFVEEPIQVQERSLLNQIEPHYEVKRYHENFLIEPEDLPFSIYETPELFTQFRKRTEKHLDFKTEWREVEECLDASAGAERMMDYIWKQQAIGTYKETRNALEGDYFSTQLSPYLAIGSLSPRQVAQQVKRFESEVLSNSSTYWVIFELLWRDFFRYMSLKHGKRLFTRGGIQQTETNLKWHQPTFEKWTTGRLNEPLIDALMLQLLQTGFMSNRGRQIVANYWCKQLKQDWRIGAAWFEHCLIDYDVSSNWGNWQYQAGVGNDRQDRFFNLEKQRRQFDPNNRFINKYTYRHEA